MKKIFLLIVFFYLISLLQTSFLIHFRNLFFLPNLILISQVLLTIFENPKENQAIFSAFVGGFFWDIFSERPIGFGISILVFLSFVIKIILRQYVRVQAFRRF
jgi:rod shape-determining protein MreD